MSREDRYRQRGICARMLSIQAGRFGCAANVRRLRSAWEIRGLRETKRNLHLLFDTVWNAGLWDSSSEPSRWMC